MFVGCSAGAEPMVGCGGGGLRLVGSAPVDGDGPGTGGTAPDGGAILVGRAPAAGTVLVGIAPVWGVIPMGSDAGDAVPHGAQYILKLHVHLASNCTVFLLFV